MERFPRSAELLVRRAEWKLEDGQKQEAIEDFDRIAELAGNKTAALVKRGEVLLKAGQFDKAVEDWKKVEQDSRRSGQPARDVALNQLAYARALAKVELDEALENINRALDIRPNEPSYLDTRGYIYYLKQEYEPALEDLDKSVAGMDSLVSKVKQAPAENRKSSKETDTLSRSERARREIIDGAAVIHYHRALVLKALGRTEDAEKDLDVARELSGREPDETLF